MFYFCCNLKGKKGNGDPDPGTLEKERRGSVRAQRSGGPTGCGGRGAQRSDLPGASVRRPGRTLLQPRKRRGEKDRSGILGPAWPAPCPAGRSNRGPGAGGRPSPGSSPNP
ncbi:translation initiation factor IF-2-like [Nycticebus coucang]|uniref:translation initiation factor IF-2-like n=1 Tax=Nycticebus coucang TaxID=9470 RepID=UPI00234DD06D|nr:translation initiation factor IF-2-like [Nycticebus coucang]